MRRTVLVAMLAVVGLAAPAAWAMGPGGCECCAARSERSAQAALERVYPPPLPIWPEGMVGATGAPPLSPMEGSRHEDHRHVLDGRTAKAVGGERDAGHLADHPAPALWFDHRGQQRIREGRSAGLAAAVERYRAELGLMTLRHRPAARHEAMAEQGTTSALRDDAALAFRAWLVERLQDASTR